MTRTVFVALFSFICTLNVYSTELDSNAEEMVFVNDSIGLKKLLNNNKAFFEKNIPFRNFLFSFSFGNKNEKLAEVYDQFFEYPKDFSLVDSMFSFCINYSQAYEGYYLFLLKKIEKSGALKKSLTDKRLIECSHIIFESGNYKAYPVLKKLIETQNNESTLSDNIKRIVDNKLKAVNSIYNIFVDIK